MNSSEIKKLLISSLDRDSDNSLVPELLGKEGINYDFSKSFTDKVIERIFSAGLKVTREVEFAKSLSLAFYRIAITGVAAIVLLLISIYFMEGSLSLNTFLGINNNYDESIVCLLTGN